MVNVHRALGLAPFFFLASCLPAAELVDDASACLSSWHAYDSSSSSWNVEGHSTTAVLTTEVQYPKFDFDVPYTTLCDGYRRAVTSRATTPTVTYDPPKTTTLNQGYPEPKPTCSIDDTACTAILTEYSSSYTTWSQAHGSGSPISPGQPHCTTYQPCDSERYPGDGYCFIHDSSAKLLYWPVITRDGDFCTKSGITVTPEPTSPPNPDTVVMDGYTFTSPTNYLSFGGLEAVLHTRRYRDTPNCGGPSYSNVVVPVTGAFSTKGLDGSRSSLNFEALNTMKFEDFKAQRRCKNNPCTVIEDFYTPELALPTEVLDLEPVEWRAAGCRGTDIGSSWYHPSVVPLVTPAPVSKGKML
jgi:hypothetical protein